jgi:hypothetical protein
VKVVYGYEQRVTVILNSMVPERALIGSPTRICSVYLRVSAENGDPLPNAAVSIIGSPMRISTDRFGRAFFGITAKQGSVIEVVAANHNAKMLRVVCDELEEIEEAVVLGAK